MKRGPSLAGFLAWSTRKSAAVGCMWFFILVSIAASRAASAQSAQSDAEQRAADELHMPGLRLVDHRHVDARVDLLGIQLAYVDTDVTPVGSRLLCGALSYDGSIDAAQPVANALARLPYTAVRRLGLRYVVLCGFVQQGNQSIGGGPVPGYALLMINVGRRISDAWLEDVTLEEVYYMAEYRFDAVNDADWDQQFTGYSNTSDALHGPPGPGAPGFLNAYSQTYPAEDRDQLFSALLLRPGDVLARISATSDSVLRRKVLFLDQKSQRLLGLKIAPDGL
jgi:hypothetical protein